MSVGGHEVAFPAASRKGRPHSITETPLYPTAPEPEHPAVTATAELLKLAGGLTIGSQADAPDGWQAQQQRHDADVEALVAECQDIAAETRAAIDVTDAANLDADVIAALPDDLDGLRKRRIHAAQWGRDLACNLAALMGQLAEHRTTALADTKAAHAVVEAEVAEDLRRVGQGEEATLTHTRGRSGYPWRDVEVARDSRSRNVEFDQLVRRNVRTCPGPVHPADGPGRAAGDRRRGQ
ncbi:MAG: hypothetical protein AAGA92_15705, partial [Planctomycetota bacterium]